MNSLGPNFLEVLTIFALVMVAAAPIIAIVLILAISKNKRTQMQSINTFSFETFAKEIREENALLKAELNKINDNLSSINKVMTAIE